MDDFALIPVVGAGAMVYDVGRSLWYDLVLPILRYPVDLAVAMVKGRAGRTVWIEAIRWNVPPRSDRFVWRTTFEHERRVLNEVANAFARGEVAEPLGATREEPWV